jgi:hypothetical protein
MILGVGEKGVDRAPDPGFRRTIGLQVGRHVLDGPAMWYEPPNTRAGAPHSGQILGALSIVSSASTPVPPGSNPIPDLKKCPF